MNLNSEEEILNNIFCPKWKNNYLISWCNLCNRAIIQCPTCKNSSCNGGGCEKCNNDFTIFNSSKIHVEDYLDEVEKLAYHKSLRLKEHIQESLSRGETEIDFKNCLKSGLFSPSEQKIFKKELSMENE